jgi:GDP-D-mannose dehydratase
VNTAVQDSKRRVALLTGVTGQDGALLAEYLLATKTGKTVVRIDPTYFRPTELDELIGDASKARQKLGWKPKTSFAQLVKEMVAGDLAIARREVAHGKNPV